MPNIDNTKLDQNSDLLTISDLKIRDAKSLVSDLLSNGSLQDKEFVDYAVGLKELPNTTKLTHYDFGNGYVLNANESKKDLDAECLLPFLTDIIATNYCLGQTTDKDTFVLETPLRNDNKSVILSVFNTSTKQLSMALCDNKGNLQEIKPENALDVFLNINTLVARLSPVSESYFGPDMKDLTTEILEMKKGCPANVSRDDFNDRFERVLSAYIDELGKIYTSKTPSLYISLLNIQTPAKEGTFSDGPFAKDTVISNATGDRKFSYFSYTDPKVIGIKDSLDWSDLSKVSDFYKFDITDEARNELRNTFFVVLPWFKSVVQKMSTKFRIDQKRIDTGRNKFDPFKIYLHGTPGDGKSAASELFAKIAGLDYVSFQITPETTGDQLLTNAKLTTKDGIMSSTYEMSDVIKHIEKGNVLVCIEEADLASPGVLVALNQLWAEGKTTIHTQDGDRVVKCGPKVFFQINSNGSLEPSTESRFSDANAVDIRTVSLTWKQALQSARDKFANSFDLGIESGYYTKEDVDEFFSVLEKLQGPIDYYNKSVTSLARKKAGQGSEIIQSLIGTRFIQSLIFTATADAVRDEQGLLSSVWSQFSNPDNQLGLRFKGSPDYEALLKKIEPILNI